MAIRATLYLPLHIMHDGYEGVSDINKTSASSYLQFQLFV